jgi:hypothetical protein
VPPATPPGAPRLLDQVRERVRYLHYSLRTEEAYVHWIRAFVRFHGRRHPRDMGGPQVEAFLSWLSTERGVSVSTHRQALSALLFLYQQVLGQQLPWMDAIGRPQRKPRLPVVLSPAEVAAVLTLLEGTHRVLAQLLYGTGMRIAEALQLRVKDVEFDRRVIVVRCGKGGKDRVVMLPATLAPALFAEMRDAFGFTLEQYVFFGGYPGAAPLVHDERRWADHVRDALVETTIGKDVLLMAPVHKPALLRRVFDLACRYSGQVLSYTKMLGTLQDAGNTTTLAHYLDLLAGAGMVCGLQKVAGRAAVRQRASSPKLQVFNTAFMARWRCTTATVSRACAPTPPCGGAWCKARWVPSCWPGGPRARTAAAP